MELNEVVVTGAGAFVPNGKDRESFWEGILEGRSGVVSIEERLDDDDFPVQFASAFNDYDPEEYFSTRESRRMDKFVQFGIISAEEALDDAGFDAEDPAYDPKRAGVVFGSGVGGLETLEGQHEKYQEKGPRRVSPYLIPKFIINMISGQVAIRANCRGPNKAVVTACATGSHALGDAARLIERGDADVMVAGGSEAGTTPLGVAGFCSIKALSTRNENPEAASRPFDKDRDGFVMGEGSGALILESREHAEKRGADIYASLSGYGQTCDAHHMTAPRDDGEGAADCMELALEDAELEPDSVDYINAHGTSTPMNDPTETKAIRSAFGDHADELKVSSTKSTTGHLLGAAGAIEAVACVLAIQRDVVPPTINYETPDPECDLDYVPNTKEELDVSVALSNTFGFGGHNATLIFTEL
jgi:3-oxoacyl-[acyl-carrier-protein] synthase II